MQWFQTSLLAVGLYCVLAKLIAGWRRGGGRENTRILSCFSLVAVAYASDWLVLFPHVGYKALWLFLVMASKLVFLIAIVWATQPFLQRKHNFDRLFPPLYRGLISSAFIALIPLVFSIHSGTQFDNRVQPISHEYGFVIHCGLFYAGAVFMCVAPCVALRLWRALPERSLPWRAWLKRPEHALLLLLVITWVCSALRVLQCSTMGPTWGLELNLIMTLEFSVLVLVLAILPSSSSPSGTMTQASREKYQASGLDQALSDRLAQKLRAMAADQDAVHQDIRSLAQLSRSLNAKPHYVSQVLNDVLGMSFHEWSNQQRLSRAAELLVQEPQRSVLNIVEHVGFNSKSTFNSHFKRRYQCTPSEYRQRHI